MRIFSLYQYVVSIFATLCIYYEIAEAYQPPSSCNTDKDCVDLSIGLSSPSDASDFKSTRIGDYMCVQKKCQYIVAAGELCRAPEECASYQSYLRNNMTAPQNLCSAKYCTIQSTCDGAWTLPYAPNGLESGSCCGGVLLDQKCSLLSGEVNSCEAGSGCVIENNASTQQRGVTVSGVCQDINEKHSIWIGIVLVLLGGTTLNIGLNLQKFALRKSQEKKKLLEQSNHENPRNSEDVNPHHTIFQKISHSLSKINPVWVVGFVIYVAASFLNFIALQFAPQSLVAPLGAISLVTNVVIAPIMNKESLGKFDIIGVIVIIAGCVLVVVFSGVVVQDYRLCVLLNLFRQTATIVYLVLIFGFIIVAFFYIKIMEKNIAPEDVDTPMTVQPEQLSLINTTQTPKDNRVSTLTSAETLNDEGMQGIHSNLKVTNKGERESIIESHDGHDSEHPISSDAFREPTNPQEPKKPWDRLHQQYRAMSFIPTLPKPIPRSSSAVRFVLPLSYACIGAMMATMTTLFAKSLINLLSVSIVQKQNQFTSGLAWVILIVTIITAFSQVYWINMGLQRYDAMLQVPVFYVIWSVFDIIGGGKSTY
ncbi:hypothetical protein K7432_002815 [Basidiobolus ranarum]|uniref:EamA domain-containing protein n=1 Tax=Basidiobolus ranarum TaxID=34480 RepID=A0ABR2X0W8_9FUNG